MIESIYGDSPFIVNVKTRDFSTDVFLLFKENASVHDVVCGHFCAYVCRLLASSPNRDG